MGTIGRTCRYALIQESTKTLGWNSRLRWEMSPGNIFFLVLNQGWEIRDGGFVPQITNFTTKLRWTFRPLGDLFVIYNHNVRERLDRWALDSNQLLVKLQYAFRY